MACQRTLLVCTTLALLSSPAVATGLQIYYFRNSTTPGNAPQTWNVAVIATVLKVETSIAYLLCNTTSNNGSGVVWTRGQGAGNSSLIQKPAANGSFLYIDNFNSGDLGKYTCSDRFSNDSLTINITSANPAIQAVSNVVTIEAGSSGQLKVYVSGVPDPTSTSITWQKLWPGGSITELVEPMVNFSSDHRTLLLSGVKLTDEGMYKCTVTQNFPSLPSASININVNVLSPAVFTQQPSNQSLNQSANVTLSCSATGSPAPTITWIRTDGRALPTSSMSAVISNSTTTSSTLSIVGIQPQDGGQYQCQAIVPGTQAVLSQPANIQVQQQAMESLLTTATIGTTTVVATNTPVATPRSTASLSESPLTSYIVGASIGGFVLLVVIGVTVFMVVTACHRCSHRSKSRAISGLNSLAEGSSTASMVRNPNYNVMWKKADHEYQDDGIVVRNSDTATSPPKSASDISSPDFCTPGESHVINHVYSTATPSQQPDSTYSRLQWNSSSTLKQPLPPPGPQSERIPMRRMGSLAASVASGPFDADDTLLSLNPSTISALSTVPSESPGPMSPSSLYKSTTLPTNMSAPFSGNKTNFAMVGSSLQSVPENPAMPAYATPVARVVETTPTSAMAPTPYLTPSMNSILTETNRVTTTSKVAPVQYDEPSYPSGVHSQPWYEDDPDANDAPLSLPTHLPPTSFHSSRPPREIQPYATIHNSAIPLTGGPSAIPPTGGPPHVRRHSRQLPRPPPPLPGPVVDVQETSFASATALV